MFESAATNGWDFRTKESAQAQRPQLTVDFTAPAGAGEVKFLSLTPVTGEGNTGSHIAMLEVARLGGTTGAISVDYAITAGTATAGDDFVAANGTIDFADGEAFTTVPVEILGDIDLEGNETITVTLSNGPVVASEEVATLTIGDDDALINEVLANITNAVNETKREYIELIGTPGASLDDYYFVVFEAEEEESGGTPDPNGPLAGPNGSGAGVADLVIDLSGLTFGANGLLVITPNDWAYTPDTDTNVFATAQLDGEGGVLEDGSQTYALVRSPGAAIVEGTDYDQVGFYENGTNQAIGTGVGILDQLPAGAQVVDSVGVVEGGGDDRDRTLAPPELGNPGIHVHQPTPFTPGGNVTSDAVSRRIGQTLANSIGAWYNGDISDGDDSSGPIHYENDTFFISVVAPDGAVLTPGAPNTLRTVYFSVDDQLTEVAEADGSLMVTIERSGDIDNETVDVTYRTFDFGSATEDVDYEGVEETITFELGEASKQITIDLLPDSEAEGFERFRLQITNVTGDYLITNGRSTTFGAINGEATVTIADADVQTATFQNGVDGYFGTEDAFLDGGQPFDRFGQDSIVRVDHVKGEGEDVITEFRPQQGLIRFDELFGDAVGQVPEGSTIFDAFLTVNVTNVASGADINFFRMLQDWEEINATWTNPQGNVGFSIVDGVTPDNIEARTTPDGTVADPGRAGLVEIPLDADTIQAWANGSLENFGWSIISDSGSLWSFNSSEAFLIGTFRPEITILYTDPDVAATGRFGLSVDEVTVNENAGSATITINRIGGSMGAATVDWSVAAGTGSLADLTGATSGSVNFADGELFKTFDIGVNNDLLIEPNETLTVSISGTGLDFARDMTTLKIRDNDFNPFSSDLLLNEIWINSPGNDPPYEFVELTGVADIGFGSLYYVAVEGLVGDRTGTAEKVVDLGAFSNGSNGLALLTPEAADFGFRVPDGTTQIDHLGSIGTENVASQNDSTTYMILYSPFTELTTTTFDYDWDDDGALDLPPGVQIVDSLGVLVLGAQDQIYGPSTNRAAFDVSDPEVDAVSRSRGNTTRNAGSAWFGGDLFPAGDDYLLYEAAESFGLPVAGAALTPGEINVGTAAESPLVALTDVTNNPDGTISLTFNGPVSQINSGNSGFAGPNGSGFSITDNAGMELPTVDPYPQVDGLGTSTLTLSFTGSGVSNGQLPAGDYRLNVVGNAIIANGRALDAANNGTSTGSDAQVDFTVTGVSVPGDFNGDGRVNIADYTVYRDTFGSVTDLRANGDDTGASQGVIDEADYDVWKAHFNQTAGSVITIGAITDSAADAASSDGVATQLAFAVFQDDTESDSADGQVYGDDVSGDSTTDDSLLLHRTAGASSRAAGNAAKGARSQSQRQEAGEDVAWEDALDTVFAGLSA